MSKFHDEFFRKGSANHDQLVAFSLRKRDEIFNRLWKKAMDLTDEVDIYFCDDENIPPWCGRPHKIAHRSKKRCMASTSGHECCGTIIPDVKYQLVNSPYVCNTSIWNKDEISVNEICKQLNILLEEETIIDNQINLRTGIFCLDKEVDGAWFVTKILPITKAKKCPISHNLISFKLDDKEIEVLCRASNNFIIGYTDLVFNYSLKAESDVELNGNWIWTKFLEEEVEIRFIVECKPKLESWGGPLRQIKTYMDLLKQPSKITIGVFTTFSHVPQEYREIMEEEGVYIITFSEDGNIIDSSSSLQTKLTDRELAETA